ncbi:MAG TPA: pyridoxamine 5'-phosphate oxidase family protein [Methanothrix sp.]|nr:pyridoxamine 5'-phosphate oxidase family protein [Methanothrix sp.]
MNIKLLIQHSNKTRKNLEENPQVAISFTDTRRWKSYQLKGKAEIYTDGPIFEQMLKIREQKEIQDRARTEQLLTNYAELMKKAEQLKKWRMNLKPKAAVMITVEEIYSHMPKLDDD